MAVGSVVCRTKVHYVVDLNRVFNFACLLGSGKLLESHVPSGHLQSNYTLLGCWARRPHHCRHMSSKDDTKKPPAPAVKPLDPSALSHRLPDPTTHSELKVEYQGGLPQVTVPLPSRRELCRFTLRPISNTVGDFLSMLREEDKGIDRVAISTKEGVRIASSNSIESLMEEDFKLLVNDREFLVQTPQLKDKLSKVDESFAVSKVKRNFWQTLYDQSVKVISETLSSFGLNFGTTNTKALTVVKTEEKEEIKRLSDVRCLVNQLYEALNVEEHQLKKERELLTKLEDLKIALEPMEKKRQELEMLACRRTNALTWVGLGLMGVQFGILARLTWWEYSWDIMEPVTYFVTYGTAMAAYAYYVLTKQEYILPDVRDRQHLIILHKRARKMGLDLEQYNALKDEMARTELDLNRLRDPLQVHLPPRYISALETKTSPLDRLKSLINKARKK
ncbi:calcium uniporter protein, mitochondrial isoform X1 [Homalodisca vitripennis]|uniref:calcium uniporter protein, mitochondrial isoform X1 n=1 Tax=Homalodisca vitripennis TaxID=197043 RepID=UPI001EE9F3D4|nr:calcium uniporter protein, mitochondrial isoform X1 [Homalodisca vitripennis]